MTQLLVSVRSAAEAAIALEGGAALIDVKEPSNGALGMASFSVIAAVLHAVAGRVPVSAALGEARADGAFLPKEIATELTFVKYGAAGCLGENHLFCAGVFARAQKCLLDMESPCRVVLAAYADWRRARAPSPSELCTFACAYRAGAFLLDTWGKDGSTLLDWMTMPELETLCQRCRAASIPIALAGALGPDQIREAVALLPDWIAVRGAVCQGGRRTSTIDLGKVRGLVARIADLTAATSAG